MTDTVEAHADRTQAPPERARRATPQQKSKPKAKRGPSPVIVVALVALLGLLGWAALRKRDGGSLSAGMPAPSALLPAAKSCTETGPAALGRALEAEQAALAKAERARFYVRDGVAAVGLYSLAASCYAQAGNAAAAQRLSSRATELGNALLADYQSHQLRLRLALDRGARDDARRETKALRALLDGRKDAYVQWLTALERKLAPVAKSRRKN